MPRDVSRRESPPMLLPLAGGSGTVVKLGELMMILELHRQGLTVSAIALDGSKRHLCLEGRCVVPARSSLHGLS